MAECRICRRKGWSISIGKNGLCKQCNEGLHVDSRVFAKDESDTITNNTDELLSEIEDSDTVNDISTSPLSSEEINTRPTPTSSDSAKKTCPYCAEEILAKAIKCKHCGEFIDRVPSRSTKTTVNISSSNNSYVMGKGTHSTRQVGGWRGQELVEIAKWQKYIIYFILLGWLAIFTPVSIVIAIGINCYLVYQYAQACKAITWIYLILAFVPIINILSLIHLNMKATDILKTGGIKVSFFGVKSTELERFKMENRISWKVNA